jgi:tetraacyldisaccharide 4'-kinase
MSGGLEARVRRWWRGESGWPGRLARGPASVLALAFRGLVALRNGLYDRGWLPARRAPIPVLGVGNLTVGGTGKTPVAAWFVWRLAEAGRRPALVARGYGRDELALHGRWNPSVPVLASTDRADAVRQAALRGSDVAVLDDGFQHRRLARDADVVLLAAETAFPGRMLPSGPYREPPEALGRADLVIVTRKSAPESRAVELAETVAAGWPLVGLARAFLAPAGWRHLDGSLAPPPEGPVLVATAVADPESVQVAVRAALAAEVAPGGHVPEPELVAFPDHHVFRPREVEALVSRAGSRTVVVTEKDAVKLLDHHAVLSRVRVLALDLRWEAGEDAVEALVEKVLAAPPPAAAEP